LGVAHLSVKERRLAIGAQDAILPYKLVEGAKMGTGRAVN